MALGSVDEKDWDYSKHISDLIYTADRATNKAGPECLRLAKRIAQCKYIISNDIAKYAAPQYSKDSFPPLYISKKIGEFEARTGEIVENIYKRNGYLWGDL